MGLFVQVLLHSSFKAARIPLNGCTSFYLTAQWTFTFVSTLATINSPCVPPWVHAQVNLEDKSVEMEFLGQRKHVFKMGYRGWAQWLMPVIPAVWEAKVGRSPEARSLRPAWPTWRNPISTKNTKLAIRGGVCL